jgi:hypothetical protein
MEKAEQREGRPRVILGLLLSKKERSLLSHSINLVFLRQLSASLQVLLVKTSWDGI